MGRAQLCNVGALSLCACGRLGFEAVPLGGSDSGADAPLVDARPMATCATYPSALLCDDFETGLGAWFRQLDGANDVVHDTAFARSGTASAHVVASESGSARLISTALDDVSSGSLYARFYQWVPSAAVTANLSILHFVSDVNPFPGFIFLVETDTMYLQSTIDATNGPDMLITFPRDSWVCVQAALLIAPADGSMVTSLDGETAATFTGNTLPPPNGYADLHIGAYLFQTEPIDYWIDDIVVATSPIPCD